MRSAPSPKINATAARKYRRKVPARSDAGLGSFLGVLPNVPDFSEIAEQAQRDGLFVLPACADRKAKHPAIAWKIYQQRAPTESESASWIGRYPDRNGLYLTGPILKRFVLDLDNAAAIAWACRQGLPRTQVVKAARDGKPYIAGNEFTLADVCIGIFIHRWYNYPVERPETPHLRAWYDRIATRPGYKAHVLRPVT